MKLHRTWTYPLYRVYRFLVWLIFPKMKLFGTENLPEGESVVVGNHSHTFGPVVGQIYMPGKHNVWCIGQMMNMKEVPAYAYEDFWSGKPKAVQWIFRILSYIIAPIASCIFNNADCIPVYHDARLMTTFKETMACLEDGSRVVIFPECYDPHNHIVHEFQNHFVDTARLYYRKTKKRLPFVPMYIAPALKSVYFLPPVTFDPERPIEEERERIAAYIMDAITKKAESLPPHKVVPYPNVPRSQYPMNRKTEKGQDGR